MKMKKLYIVLAMVLIAGFSALSVPIATAFTYEAPIVTPVDFGNNNDYDTGGSSDWGGGSDFSFDFDYDSDYSSSGSSSDENFVVEIGILFALVSLVVILSTFKQIAKTRAGTLKENGAQNIQQNAGRNVIVPNRTVDISNIIKQRDPYFSAEDFISYAKFVFVTIQDAWSDRNLEPVRIYLHNNLYNQTQKQVEEKLERGIINKVENVAVSTAYLTSYYKDKNYEYLTVYLNARMTDYEINEKTQKVVRGNPNARYELRYALKFVRSCGVKTNNSQQLRAHTCPNCGAPLEMANAGQCDYCGSILTTGTYSWVLSEYSSIRNDYIDQGININSNPNI